MKKIIMIIILFGQISHARFTSIDPAREFVNPYSYTGNNPIIYIDPTGEIIRVATGNRKMIFNLYTRSATFRRLYDSLHFDKNHPDGKNDWDVDITISRLNPRKKQELALKNVRAESTLTYTFQKNKIIKVEGEPVVSNKKEAAHELAHIVENFEVGLTPRAMYEDPELREKYGVTLTKKGEGYETRGAINIEKMIINELGDKKDDLKFKDKEERKALWNKLFDYDVKKKEKK